MPSLSERIHAGERLVGAISSLPDPFAAEVFAAAGFDWICVDLQHGMATPASLVGILQAFSITATPVLVRVPWNEPAPIMRALDAGAAGVIVPMVNSAADAQAAVAACRYPPDGIRSWGPTRALLRQAGYSVEAANAAVVCAVMIETRRGLDAADEILAVPGVDAVFVGPSDLAVDLGMAPSLAADAPSVHEALGRIVDAANRHGVCPAIFTSGHDAVTRLSAMGFRLLTAGSDRLLMLEAARGLAASLRTPASPSSS